MIPPPSLRPGARGSIERLNASRSHRRTAATRPSENAIAEPLVRGENPEMATRIFLFRHGETEWSLAGRHTGSTDLPLTADGVRQVGGLRRLIENVRFSHVVTSPLLRARATCDHIGLGAGARIEADLREWDYGDYEGLTTAAIHTGRPDWNVFQDGAPHGESVAQISDRADRVLASLAPLRGTVALFSHGHFLRALAARWIGLPAGAGRNLALETASLSILGHEHQNSTVPAIIRWNVSSAAEPGV